MWLIYGLIDWLLCLSVYVMIDWLLCVYVCLWVYVIDLWVDRLDKHWLISLINRLSAVCMWHISVCVCSSVNDLCVCVWQHQWFLCVCDSVGDMCVCVSIGDFLGVCDSVSYLCVCDSVGDFCMWQCQGFVCVRQCQWFFCVCVTASVICVCVWRHQWFVCVCVTAAVLCVCLWPRQWCLCVCDSVSDFVCDSMSDCVCDSISDLCVCVWQHQWFVCGGTASVVSVCVCVGDSISGFCVCVTASVPQLGSPSGYNTLGRPSSLPLSKQSYQRSTSNPDLAGNTPTSPDAEVLAYIGTFAWAPHVVCLNVHLSSVPLKSVVETGQRSVQIPQSESSHWVADPFGWLCLRLSAFLYFWPYQVRLGNRCIMEIINWWVDGGSQGSFLF